MALIPTPIPSKIKYTRRPDDSGWLGVLLTKSGQLGFLCEYTRVETLREAAGRLYFNIASGNSDHVGKEASLKKENAENVWSAAVLQAKCEIDMLGCANVSGLCWSRSPGLNGMRCALVLFSFAAFEGCFRIKVSRAPGSTVVPSHASPANLAGMSKSHMIQPSSLVCRCGNRGCDFQAWRFCQASCAGQAFQAAAVCGTSGGR